MKRKEQAAIAKEKLLTTAQKLISEKGYDKISISDITDACGMSVGNFYHYFKSKEELIIAVERDLYDRNLENVRKLQGKSIIDLLTFYFTNSMDYAVNVYGVNFTRQWFIYHLSNPTTLHDPANKINITIQEVKECLESSRRNGELRNDAPLDILAEDIVLSTWGAQFYTILTDGEFDLIAWNERYCKTVLKQILEPYYAVG
ncbi:TetR/AcrR family transcriptional regulator [Diplocloster hominis]|uniref:TetR/AcrR family transcriptional regulator n=1 Tax=Diplocloster hominis TaxID=3079010 RepID=UPI0031BB4CD2